MSYLRWVAFQTKFHGRLATTGLKVMRASWLDWTRELPIGCCMEDCAFAAQFIRRRELKSKFAALTNDLFSMPR